jgi:hypothetical protein
MIAVSEVCQDVSNSTDGRGERGGSAPASGHRPTIKVQKWCGKAYESNYLAMRSAQTQGSMRLLVAQDTMYASLQLTRTQLPAGRDVD